MTDEEIIKQEIVKEDTETKTTYHYINVEKNLDFPTKIIYKKVNKIELPQVKIKWGSNNEIVPKFKHLKNIIFLGFNQKIPSGFSQKAALGYRPTPTLDPLIKFIAKKTNTTELIISRTETSKKKSDVLTLKYSDLEKLRSIISTSNRNNKLTIDERIHNYLSEKIPAGFSSIDKKYKKDELATLISTRKQVENNLSSEDKKELTKLFELLSLSPEKYFEEQEFLTTKKKIEKKYVDEALTEFKRKLTLSKVSEERWQEFFKKNAWIFSQLFSYPAVLFEDKAYVGGTTVANKDGKIADFLYRSDYGGNIAFIEIKTNKSLLMNKIPYRGTNVFSVSPDLSGGINQVLDQRAHFQHQYWILKGTSEKDFISKNSRCFLIIGNHSQLTKKQSECFELFRNSCKDVEIITFDELLTKLETMFQLLGIEGND
jgi:hypothetical protein